MDRLTPVLVVIALATVALACSEPLEIGQECSDSADCREGLSCFFDDGTMMTSVCMANCDDTSTRICDMGEVCIPSTLMGVPRDEGVCFLGGVTPVGGACVDTFDCGRGSLCVSVGDASTCYRACRTDDMESSCLTGETCEALVGMGTNGYCAATP